MICLFSIHNNNNEVFFFYLGFHEYSRITGVQGKGKGISSTLPYLFHPLCRHLDISRTNREGVSPLQIASSQTRTRALWFPSASRKPLNYTPLQFKWFYFINKHEGIAFKISFSKIWTKLLNEFIFWTFAKVLSNQVMFEIFKPSSLWRKSIIM